MQWRNNERNGSSDHLISANYSATSGMSGSPIYIFNNGDCELVGINVGGCCLPYQFEIASIVSLLLTDNIHEAYESFERVKENILTSHDYEHSDLIASFEVIDGHFRSKIAEHIVTSLSTLINTLALAFKRQLHLDHNVSVSVTHPVFNEIRAIIRKFKELPILYFNNAAELYEVLIK